MQKILYLSVYAILAVSALLHSNVWASSATLADAVDYVLIGRWDAALQILQTAENPAGPSARQIQGLLLEHKALERQRAEQRSSVYDEKRSAFESAQFGANDESALFEAMGLFKSAWDNAAPTEREHLLNLPNYITLREIVENRFSEAYKAGQWDDAWSKWLRWLDLFEPNRYRQAVEDVSQRRALAEAIGVNPCDDTIVPYVKVTRNTAIRIFKILDSKYPEPVPFDRVTQRGLQRLALLPEVLGNPTLSLAFHADTETFEGWLSHIHKLMSADPPGSVADVSDLLDILLTVNATTLALPEGVVVAQFTESALEALDPYTEAIWPEGIGEFEKHLTGQFGGVGVRIRKDSGQLVIASVIPDTPAAATILAADDVIVAVDGRSVQDIPTVCAAALISGPVGTSVSLTVRPAGSDTTEVVTVKRRQVVLPTIEGAKRADNENTHGHWDYFLDTKDRIGYLHLNGFTNKTAEQARQVLEQLEEKEMSGLIVDMRGNGGGLLDEATAFANLFIADGLLLSSRGRDNDTTVWKAVVNSVQRSYPIVFLIDEASASASEIAAGAVAVRKPDQVTLIGQRTYGKGTVQDVVSLGDVGGRLKLTTAYYFLPDGRPVQNRYRLEAGGRTDWGIAPTIELPLYAFERTRIRQIQNERRKQLMDRDLHGDVEKHNESLVRQMLMADAQLSAAVVVLKARILTGY